MDTPYGPVEAKLDGIERMVDQIHQEGLMRTRRRSDAPLSDEKNATIMTGDVMDIIRKLVLMRGPLVLLALLMLGSCTVGKPPPAATYAQTFGSPPDGECENIGWTVDGDICYDGKVGPSKPVSGHCCEQLRAAVKAANEGHHLPNGCPMARGRDTAGQCVNSKNQPIAEHCCVF